MATPVVTAKGRQYFERCGGCHRPVPIGEFCGCDFSQRKMAEWDAMMRLPKPATPEPRWKGPPTLTVAAGTLGPNDVLHIEGTATWPNGHVGPVDVQVLSVEKIDRALEDFTARRKAKRERAAYALDDELCGYESWDAFDAAHEKARIREATQDQIARAMSAPLPHDPDIHTRLMPWRGKE